MRRITTPLLCLLLGLLMVFVVLVDVSGAAADDDDDDDSRSYRYSEWRHHGHHHGKKHWHRRHGHYHWHCGDDDDCEYDDDDDDDDAHHHGKGYGRWHHGHHKARRGSDWIYLEEDEAVEVEPVGPVIWRNPDTTLPDNPPAPPAQSKTQAESPGEYASGPCREYYTTARVGGRIQQIYGHACRQPDGSWKFMR